MILALVAGGIAFGMTELMVRWFAPQPLGVSDVHQLRRGPFTSPGKHELRTAEFHVQVQVNSNGFVDHEWGPRRPGVPRVLLVGDSFVQAAQVPMERGLGRVLATEVSARVGTEVEVLSMGVPGAGTATALDLVVTEGLALEPDLVILGFLVSNDIMNNHPLLEGKTDKPFYRLEGDALVRTDREETLSRDVDGVPMWQSSHAIRWMARRWMRNEEASRQLSEGQGIPIPLRVHDPQAGPVWEASWAVTERLLAELAQACGAQGVGFGVMLIPDAAQVSLSGRQKLVEQWPIAQGWRLDAATRRAETMAGKVAPVFDLQPPLSDAGGGMYFERDGHWTAAGHQAAAHAAAPWVSGLLSAPE